MRLILSCSHEVDRDIPADIDLDSLANFATAQCPQGCGERMIVAQKPSVIPPMRLIVLGAEGITLLQEDGAELVTWRWSELAECTDTLRDMGLIYLFFAPRMRMTRRFIAAVP